jgi:hypothetical protein
VLAPPAIPRDRLNALRAAFMATMKDPAFRSDAKNLSPDEVPDAGDVVQRFIERLHSIPPHIVKQAIALKS